MKDEKNKTIELSESQQNPGLAKPEDFRVIESHDANYLGSLPFHGQCGDTEREYNSLLAVRETGKQ